jgi:hypothetical protein
VVGCSGGAGAAVKAVTAVAVGGGGSPAFLTLQIFNSCLLIVPSPRSKSAVTMQVVLELFWLRVGTKLMATMVPTTSLVFAQPPYLHEHSDKFVTCIAFA